jgi:acyl dehydratase
MSGRWFEEWQVGDQLVHQLRRTVTEADNLLMSCLTHNTQPLHLDAEAAAASEFGRILVNGTFTFALMIGLSVGDTTAGTLIANLGYEKVIMPKPVFVGDTMHAESEVAALKESRSRPTAGIVTFKHRLINQRNQIVCECLRVALLERKPASKHESGTRDLAGLTGGT